MRRHGESRALRYAAMAAFGGALAALLAVPAGAAWDGNQAIDLGNTVSAEFAGAPGAEVHRFSFFATEEARISALLKGQSGLVTKLDLLNAANQDVDTTAAEKPTGINNFMVPGAGHYSFQIQATSGTGAYTLRTKSKARTKFTEKLTTTLTYEFGAPKGTLITALVKKSKGSAAVPTFTKIAGPTGDLPGVADATKLNKLEIPVDGMYTITVANAGTAGDSIDLALILKLPKSKRTFAFPAMSLTIGTASVQRGLWLTSGHADRTAEAFVHWDEDVPAVVSASCAKCHSGGGYEDFLGADGTAAGTIENTHAAGLRTVDCNACHNDVATNLTQVTFPSGQTVTGLGHEARCMVCHQGRESTKSLEDYIASKNPVDDDTVTAGLGFRNVHYFAAGATLYGRQAEGAYEYPDPSDVSGATDPVTGLTRRMPYDRKFAHVSQFDTCIGCHDPHTLERKIEKCATCHVKADGTPVANDEDLKDIRMAGTTEDYDGDTDKTEGVYWEMKGLADILYAAIRDYAANVAGTAIVYDPASHPYFFTDTNADGDHDDGEGSYASWTPRLDRAAYNYQYFQKDPGAFAHNSKYLIEVLYDSIASLNAVRPVANFASLVRNDKTHFDSSADAYRDWDTAGLEGSTPAACTRCHSVEGFEFVVANPNVRNQPMNGALTSGMTCESCHVDGANFSPVGGNAPERVYVSKVIFPFQDFSTSSTAAPASTGAQIAAVTINNDPANPDDSFICMTCHQGRQSMLTLNAYVAARSGAALETMSFQNLHYLAAGGTQYSTKAGVGYVWTGIADEAATAWPGRTYQGPWTHDAEAAWVPAAAGVGGMNEKAQCTYCHMQDGSHRFEVVGTASCTACHTGTDVTTYRKGTGMNTDFGGKGTVGKLEEDRAAFEAALLKALNTYAVAHGKRKMAYDPSAYSYLFYDDDGDGVPDSTASAGRYAQLDKFMQFGAHNMHMSHKDVGSWAHNTRFMFQIMYDAIDYLDDGLWNGSPVNATTGNPLVRPTTTY